MAACDYRLCDKCGAKTFYDANLNYVSASDEDEAYKQVGEQQFYNSLCRLGDWAVLCVPCSKIWKTAIVKREASDEASETRGTE